MKVEKETIQTMVGKNESIKLKIKQQEKLYNDDLPQYVQRLHDITKETSKFFGIVPQQEIDKIKSRKLSKIFDLLNPLKDIHNIELRFEYEPDLFECFEI